jgi:ribulose-phosphate 3-epimerase
VHLHRSVHWIKDSGVMAGVSLNPATPVWSLDHIFQDLDVVLIMSVNPGFGGQSFIPQVLHKIKTCREIITERGLQGLIEVDGGVKYDNAKTVADAGADILVMGSAFFNSGDYSSLTSRLRKLLHDR